MDEVSEKTAVDTSTRDADLHLDNKKSEDHEWRYIERRLLNLGFTSCKVSDRSVGRIANFRPYVLESSPYRKCHCLNMTSIPLLRSPKSILSLETCRITTGIHHVQLSKHVTRFFESRQAHDLLTQFRSRFDDALREARATSLPTDVSGSHLIS